jgi:hypothetical protein
VFRGQAHGGRTVPSLPADRPVPLEDEAPAGIGPMVLVARQSARLSSWLPIGEPLEGRIGAVSSQAERGPGCVLATRQRSTALEASKRSACRSGRTKCAASRRAAATRHPRVGRRAPSAPPNRRRRKPPDPRRLQPPLTPPRAAAPAAKPPTPLPSRRAAPAATPPQAAGRQGRTATSIPERRSRAGPGHWQVCVGRRPPGPAGRGSARVRSARSPWRRGRRRGRQWPARWRRR